MGSDDGIPRRQLEKISEMSVSERRNRLSELGDLLSEESPYVRSHAMGLVADLSEIYPAEVGEIIDPVAEQFGTDAVGVDAARVFSNVASEKPAAVVDRLPHLVAVIDSGGEVTEYLTDALVPIGGRTPEVLAQRGILNQLFVLLEGESPVVRKNVSRVLGDIASIEPEKVAKEGDALRDRLDDSSPTVQRNAAYTLGHLSESSPKVVCDSFEALCRLLHTSNPDVRAAAAYALSAASAGMNSADEESVESLVESLRSDQPLVRQHAAFVLAEMAVANPEPVRPYARRLIVGIADTHPQVRQNLVSAVTSLEAESPDAVEAAKTQVSEELKSLDVAEPSSEIREAELRGLTMEETAPVELRQAAREAVSLAGSRDTTAETATTETGQQSPQTPSGQRESAGDATVTQVCSNCGEQFGPDADFCSICGMSLE